MINCKWIKNKYVINNFITIKYQILVFLINILNIGVRDEKVSTDQRNNFIDPHDKLRRVQIGFQRRR